jgi:putative lipase involved disintegration of autophagic bodies
LEKSILETEFYYDHALEIYKDVEDQFPDSAIWLTGHSLGGALASMVGSTGIKEITFTSLTGNKLAYLAFWTYRRSDICWCLYST